MAVDPVLGASGICALLALLLALRMHKKPDVLPPADHRCERGKPGAVP